MKFNIISSNIRFDNPEDGNHCWQRRRKVLAEKIVALSPHILGTQEGRRPQLEDLKSLIPLNLIDAHRHWIDERMYPSLFISPELTVRESGDIWLSQTPHIPGSKSFGSSFPRLATWAKVELDGGPMVVANLHLDHLHSETRQQQIKIFTAEIKKIHQGQCPLVVCGDFNEGPDTPVYQWVSDELSLSDPWRALEQPEQSSHHRFDGNTSSGKRIDWILLSEHFKARRIFFDNLPAERGDLRGVYPSDHFPLFVSVDLDHPSHFPT